MYQVIEPKSEEEFERYYQFRWQQLRAPFNLPKGSEKDEYDQCAAHRMIVNRHQWPVAVGRLYQISSDEAQIRFMAVADEYRGKGLGTRLICALEEQARHLGVKRLVLNARLAAVAFCQKNGFHPVGEGPTHFGKIKHQQMQKEITQIASNRNYGEWCDELISSWQELVPLTGQMGIRIKEYTGSELRLTAPVSPNINHTGGMFAGSLYAMGCLAGWGLLHLRLKERKIDASIILVNGEIRYLHCAKQDVIAQADTKSIKGSIWPLLRDKKVLFKVPVLLHSDGVPVAEFRGKFMAIPEESE